MVGICHRMICYTNVNLIAYEPWMQWCVKADSWFSVTNVLLCWGYQRGSCVRDRRLMGTLYFLFNFALKNKGYWWSGISQTLREFIKETREPRGKKRGVGFKETETVNFQEAGNYHSFGWGTKENTLNLSVTDIRRVSFSHRVGQTLHYRVERREGVLKTDQIDYYFFFLQSVDWHCIQRGAGS